MDAFFRRIAEAGGNLLSDALSKHVVEPSEDGFDKSKSRYPAPPAGKRRSTLMGLLLIGLLALGVSFALFDDAKYALSGAALTELGALASADLESKGGWVSGTGMIEEDALSFKRRGEYGSFLLTSLKERPELLVALRVPKSLGKAEEYLPPHRFTGRLIKLDEASLNQRSMIRVIESSKFSASAPKYLLLEGESPESKKDSLWAALLLGTLGLVALFSSAHLFARLGRKEPAQAV